MVVYVIICTEAVVKGLGSWELAVDVVAVGDEGLTKLELGLEVEDGPVVDEVEENPLEEVDEKLRLKVDDSPVVEGDCCEEREREREVYPIAYIPPPPHALVWPSNPTAFTAPLETSTVDVTKDPSTKSISSNWVASTPLGRLS
jgi:hypothetical protein